MGFRKAIKGLLIGPKPQYGARSKASEKGNAGPTIAGPGMKKSTEEASFEQFIKKVKGPKIK